MLLLPPLPAKGLGVAHDLCADGGDVPPSLPNAPCRVRERGLPFAPLGPAGLQTSRFSPLLGCGPVSPPPKGSKGRRPSSGPTPRGPVFCRMGANGYGSCVSPAEHHSPCPRQRWPLVASCCACSERPPALFTAPHTAIQSSVFLGSCSSLERRVGKAIPFGVEGRPGDRWVRGSPPLGPVQSGARVPGHTGPWSAFCPRLCYRALCHCHICPSAPLPLSLSLSFPFSVSWSP